VTAPLGYYEQSYPPSLWGGGVVDPDITSLVPATGSAAAGPITVHVHGAGFVAGSVVEADGAALPTTYVSATELTAPFDPAAAGTVMFTVRNPSAKESNSQPFVVGAEVRSAAKRKTRTTTEDGSRE
jgi:hypothetical protein